MCATWSGGGGWMNERARTGTKVRQCTWGLDLLLRDNLTDINFAFLDHHLSTHWLKVAYGSAIQARPSISAAFVYIPIVLTSHRMNAFLKMQNSKVEAIFPSPQWRNSERLHEKVQSFVFRIINFICLFSVMESFMMKCILIPHHNSWFFLVHVSISITCCVGIDMRYVGNRWMRLPTHVISPPTVLVWSSVNVLSTNPSNVLSVDPTAFEDGFCIL